MAFLSSSLLVRGRAMKPHHRLASTALERLFRNWVSQRLRRKLLVFDGFRSHRELEFASPGLLLRNRFGP